MTRPTTSDLTAGSARALALLAVMAVMVAATSWPGPACAGDLSATAADTMRLSVIPVPAHGQAGDILRVDLAVPVKGPAFNAYDAYLSYDPAMLQFLPAADPSLQEGLLMTAACGSRFHIFQADTLAGRLRVSHSLLCADSTVTGPGIVYQLSFRCRDVEAVTRLELLRSAPYRTRFFLDGLFVLPLVTEDALVRVGAGSPSTAPLPPADIMDLRATPNPFNPRTTISFEALRAGHVAVSIYGVDGRLVRRLWQGDVGVGAWHGDWDGRDDRGLPLAAGVYLVKVSVGDRESVVRLTLVR